MENIKPIKRSRELAPFSRDHHEGLLFVWKIKKGIDNKTPLEILCSYTCWFWANHFKSHFKNEESVLVKHLSADDPMIKQMLKEHEQIKDLVISLDKEPDERSLKLLAGYISNHIRFEERQLFPYIEKMLTPEQMNEISNDLPQELHCDTDPIAIGWKDEFWAK